MVPQSTEESPIMNNAGTGEGGSGGGGGSDNGTSRGGGGGGGGKTERFLDGV